jgi:hypothetical protein
MIKTKEPKLKERYSLYELADSKLIPGVDTYAVAYNLATTKVGEERVLNSETTNRGIKAEHDGKAWSKISGKIYVRGEDIKIFLKLNNLL